MIFNLSTTSLTFFVAIGVASTVAGSNLRQYERRASLFHHDDEDKTAEVVAASSSGSNLRSPILPSPSSGSNVDQESLTPSNPSITLNKSSYAESESITVSFSVGPSSHPYYSSPDVPSRNIDYNYPKWSIGLFMRDADPQGGTLRPIVSMNVCGALGEDCDANDRTYSSYDGLSVTFGDGEWESLMDGHWPLEVSQYGTGYDAYVLDGNGAAAIGPLEFLIRDEYAEDEVDSGNAVHYQPSSSVSSSLSSVSSSTPSMPLSGLMKYNKGTKKVTANHHADVAKPTTVDVETYNAKIIEANTVELLPESSATPITNSGGTGSASSITSDQQEYQEDDSVSINFTIDSNADLSKYRIGIFMRMANPQGGSLDPVVSLPLFSDSSAAAASTGSVTFSAESYMAGEMKGSQWPLNLYEWGTGFDAYVLDESGADVTGPVKFNIMMSDTY